MECVHIRTCNEKSPWGKEKERTGKEEGEGTDRRRNKGQRRGAKGGRKLDTILYSVISLES